MKNGRLTAYSATDQKTPNSTALKFFISQDVRFGFLTDRGNLWAMAVTLFLIIVQVAVISYYFGKLPPQIPIFYSTTWGETMMGTSSFIFVLPILAVFFVLLNVVIYFAFFRDTKQTFSENKFLARVLFVSSMLVGFCTFWGTVKIVTLLA